jgi:predicted metalloendopeptidase
MRSIIATNGHAPDQYRALTVRNLDAWYAAFGVKPGMRCICRRRSGRRSGKKEG